MPRCAVSPIVLRILEVGCGHAVLVAAIAADGYSRENDGDLPPAGDIPCMPRGQQRQVRPRVCCQMQGGMVKGLGNNELDGEAVSTRPGPDPLTRAQSGNG